MTRASQILFVYNADTGVFSLVSDFAHKILSPQTYTCNLCKLTYGAFHMQKQWKDFLAGLTVAKRFLHKDEFQKEYPQAASVSLPAVFALVDGQPVELISASQINRQTDLQGLQALVTAALEAS